MCDSAWIVSFNVWTVVSGETSRERRSATGCEGAFRVIRLLEMSELMFVKVV
jgi:hypothetical protein